MRFATRNLEPHFSVLITGTPPTHLLPHGWPKYFLQHVRAHIRLCEAGQVPQASAVKLMLPNRHRWAEVAKQAWSCEGYKYKGYLVHPGKKGH